MGTMATLNRVSIVFIGNALSKVSSSISVSALNVCCKSCVMYVMFIECEMSSERVMSTFPISANTAALSLIFIWLLLLLLLRPPRILPCCDVTRITWAFSTSVAITFSLLSTKLISWSWDGLRSVDSP